jgi:hypothetical protein
MFADVSEERTASSAPYKQLLYVCALPMGCYGLLFDPEDGGSIFFRNVNELGPNYTQ